MSAHTPGPWGWDGSVWSYDKTQEAPWLIRVGMPPTAPCVSVLRGEIECASIADARLIAAAPDLLAALERIASSPAADNGMHDGSGQRVVDVARAAIAKAKGGTP